MHILKHIGKAFKLFILVFETSTFQSTKSKVMTLTFRRGLYSFVWWIGSRRPQRQIIWSFVRAFFVRISAN